jgi:hypothetical protein
MKNGVILRIAMWFGAGFLVSAGWGLYLAYADKASPIEPIVYGLFRWTQPIAALTVAYFDFPRGLSSTAIENAVTYALLGLILETIRRHFRRAAISTS